MMRGQQKMEDVHEILSMNCWLQSSAKNFPLEMERNISSLIIFIFTFNDCCLHKDGFLKAPPPEDPHNHGDRGDYKDRSRARRAVGSAVFSPFGVPVSPNGENPLLKMAKRCQSDHTYTLDHICWL